MNYFVHYQHNGYDPSSQSQESHDQSTNNYYPYSYSYPNPQFSGSINPYSYENPIVQPSQHEEQEPNPPGVMPPPPPPPPPEPSRNSYYHYHAHGAAAGVPTVGTQLGEVVHQPIVQPFYGHIGNMGGTVPRGDAQIHFGPNLNVSSYPFHASGRGRGNALPTNAAIPFQDQTVIAHGGFHIQGGPSQLPSQSFGETHHVPRPKFSHRTYSDRGRGCGRGRGRGRGRVLQKHAVAPAPDLQCKPDILGGGSQPMAESSASSSGQKLVLLQGPAPHPKVVSCELCKIECNTLEVLQQHMAGKKHKKKLKVMEELRNLKERVNSGQSEKTSTPELKLDEVPSQPDAAEVSYSQEMKGESNVAGGKRKVEEVVPEPPQESAKKKRVGPSKRKPKKSGKSNRKLRGCDGSKSLVQAPDKAKEVAAVALVCELCNVKCESVVVFQSHLVGKKHKSKAKRFLGQEYELLQLQKAAVGGDASSFLSEHGDARGASVDGGSTLKENAVS